MKKNMNNQKNKNMHKNFIELGRERNKLTYRLLAMLPEIYQKKIYRKYAATIYEYAGKFAGLSKSVVEKTLRVQKHLIEKPKLREAVKEYGIHKVSLVATLAKPEDEEMWIDKMKNMSKSALEVFTKEIREKTKQKDRQSFSFEPFLTPKSNNEIMSVNEYSNESRCWAKDEKIKIELDGDLMFEFLKLKKRLEKEKKEKTFQ